MAALGCNIAWGIIDGAFFLMASFAKKGRGLLALRSVRNPADAGAAHAIIAASLPKPVSSILTSADLEAMRQRLSTFSEPIGYLRLTKDDWLAALGFFCWNSSQVRSYLLRTPRSRCACLTLSLWCCCF
jgi:hypothetical protein